MKKNYLLAFACIFIVLFSNKVNAQKFKGLDKSPMDVISFPDNYRISDKIIKITYSRPQLKGRSLAKLVPFGKKWRTGANEATEITFYKNVDIGGAPLKAGTYTLYTIPGSKNWTIVFSNQLNVWGVYFHKPENDVLRVVVPVKKAKESIEAFSISIDDQMTIHMGWGETIVSIPVK